MDETNPTDITANPATGSNTVPAAPAESAQQRPTGEITPPSSVQSVQTSIPIPTVLPIQSVPVQSPVQIPVPPVQLVPLPPIQNVPAEDATAPVTSDTLAPQAAIPPAPKPLRDDIARIIGKIKLPERIALKMSGEKAKPPTLPGAPAIPPAPEKEAAGNEKSPQPVEAPAQTQRQNEEAQKEAPSSVTSVHTLKDDLQNVVRDKKMSLVRAVALESEKKRGQEHLAGPHIQGGAHPSKVIGVAFVAVIFLVLGFVVFVGVRSVLQQGAGNAQPASAPSLIFAEKTLTFPQEERTGIDLRRTLMAGVRNVSNIPLGAIIRIVPTASQTDANGAATEQAVSIGDFLTALGTQETPELVRSFRGDFFLGLHQTVGKLSPVIIIPVTSYERAFAGMLAWEPTMNGDLSPIFTSIPPQTKDANGLFVERQFEDTLINNYDVRVLKDDSGATQMLYSFPTRTMLIISESPYSFTEVLSRLRASRQL
ncbi:MAG: hypothetical protein Q7S08_04570 [bacterium]|nr:hypothetical protein [bacterium]